MNSVLITTSWSELDVRSKANWAAELVDRGYDVTVVTLDDQGTAVARDYIENVVQLQLPDNSTITATELEAQWEIPSVPLLYRTEQEYFALGESQARKRTLHVATAVADLFERQEFDLVYQGRGSEIHRLLIYYAAKHNDAMTVWGDFSPFTDSIAFGTGLDGTWANYQTTPYEQMSEEERQETRSLVSTFKEQKQFYSHGNDDSGGILPADPISPFIQIYDWVTSTRPRNPSGMIRRKLRQRVNTQLNKRLLPSAEESAQLASSNRYVYFPLQYPVESRLTLFSPQCYNQRSIIEYLSRILPADVRLIVKQHPNHPGHQSPMWLRSVDKLENVDIVSPSLNSHTLIQSAAAVVVTNNTVGFEALFYETPLVVLGAAFYMDTPAAQQVHDYGRLPEVLSTAIKSKTTEEEILSSIYSLQQAKFDVDGTVGTKRHAKDIVDAMCEFISSTYKYELT